MELPWVLMVKGTSETREAMTVHSSAVQPDKWRAQANRTFKLKELLCPTLKTDFVKVRHGSPKASLTSSPSQLSLLLRTEGSSFTNKPA